MNLDEAKEHYKNNPVVKCLIRNSGKLINSKTIRIAHGAIVANNYSNQVVSLVEFGECAKIIDAG